MPIIGQIELRYGQVTSRETIESIKDILQRADDIRTIMGTLGRLIIDSK